MKVSATRLLSLVALSILVGGCTTAYQEELRRLRVQEQRGEISAHEYEQRLRDLEESQPWGGVGGVHAEDKLPVWINPDMTRERDDRSLGEWGRHD